MILIFGALGGCFSHFYFKIRVNYLSWWVIHRWWNLFWPCVFIFKLLCENVVAYPRVKAGASATVTEWWCMFWGFLLVWQGNNYRLQYGRLWPWSISSYVGPFVISGKSSVALLTKAYCTVYHDIPLRQSDGCVCFCSCTSVLLTEVWY